jgi:hypothetical protein
MAITKRELPIPWDFVFWQDADFRFIYRVKNPDGTAMNNTGWQIDMDIRLSPNSKVMDRLSTVTGEIVVGGVTGYVTISVPKSVVATYTPGKFFYDIREIYPGNTTGTPRFKGAVRIQEMITHE